VGQGGGVYGGDGDGDLINIEYKAVQNYHNKSPLYSEYMLIKMEKRTEIK
jgi:hypothetical protein